MKSKNINYNFDFSEESSVMVLDIRRNLEGNVSEYSTKFTDTVNDEYIDNMVKACHYIDDEDKNEVFSIFSNFSKEISISKKISKYTTHNNI